MAKHTQQLYLCFEDIQAIIWLTRYVSRKNPSVNGNVLRRERKVVVMGTVSNSLRYRDCLINSLADVDEVPLINDFIDDSLRSQKNIASRIQSIKEHLKLAKGDTKKLLEEQLQEQENAWFQLHRDAYINSCKRGGILSLDALAQIPGFSGDILFKQYEQLQAKRESNNRKNKREKINLKPIKPK